MKSIIMHTFTLSHQVKMYKLKLTHLIIIEIFLLKRHKIRSNKPILKDNLIKILLMSINKQISITLKLILCHRRITWGKLLDCKEIRMMTIIYIFSLTHRVNILSSSKFTKIVTFREPRRYQSPYKLWPIFVPAKWCIQANLSSTPNYSLWIRDGVYE